MSHEVVEKWGFGMAPPKPETQTAREQSVRVVIKAIIDSTLSPWPQDVLMAISEVKGLFMRVVRMDQWDWFTVSAQLGYPSRGLAKLCGISLADLRIAARDGDEAELRRRQKFLCETPIRHCLRVFLGELAISDDPNAGWIYILSTRELPNLLKVGVTTRTVQDRVKEINAATGVAIPFGVRCCWRVVAPHQSERILHKVLDGARIRADREFFRIGFSEAVHRIQGALNEERLEIRPLLHLSPQ
jgi:hypothetical protein